MNVLKKIYYAISGIISLLIAGLFLLITFPISEYSLICIITVRKQKYNKSVIYLTKTRYKYVISGCNFCSH